jgi:hypothetical protein
MVKQGFGILAIVGGATLLLSLSGCYTQLGSFRDPHEPGYSSDNYQDSDVVADSVSEDEYAEARQRFYDESYGTSIGIGYDYTWDSPMYGHGYRWSGFGYPWYYDPFFPWYAGIAPWYAYPGHYFRGGGGYLAGRASMPNTTRRIGTNRTYGTTRGGADNSRTVPAYVPLPVGARSDKTGTTAGTPVPTRGQAGVNTGRRGASGERRAPPTAVPPADKSGTTQGGSRPKPETPPPAPAPDAGRRSSGESRTTERPAYTPPPSPPPAPPPSNQPAPSGGNRGGENRGGNEGSGSRGGNRR